jgi:hypothetical protein
MISQGIKHRPENHIKGPSPKLTNLSKVPDGAACLLGDTLAM